MRKLYPFYNVREIKNLTPHDVVVIKADGTKDVYKPEATPARVDVELIPVEANSPIPVYEEIYGDVQNLPGPVFGTILIVSGVVCSARPDRIDLAHPVKYIRDDQGRVVGCEGITLPNIILTD